jgi:hypothetical protein
MKTFYREQHIEPRKYRKEELEEMLRPAILAKMAKAIKKKKFLVVEHSGIGKICELIAEFDHLTIWISTPIEVIKKRISESTTMTPTFTSTEATALNKKIYWAFVDGKIVYDVKYFTITDMFYPALDLSQLRAQLNSE